MRTFTVLVLADSGKWLAYPKASGPVCLKSMEVLASRGRQVKAQTTANLITETLTLEQMRGSVLHHH